MFDSLRIVLTHLEGTWRFRWHALLVVWILCLAGWVYVYCIPDAYQARAQVYIDTQSVMKPLLDGLAVGPEVTDRVGMMTRALVSRPTLAEVARGIEPDFDQLPPVKQHAMVAGMEHRIYVGPGERENIYEIRFEDQSREKALRVVELLLHNLVEDTVALTRTDTSMAQEFLHSQIDDYEKRLQAAERRLATFKKRHVGLMPSEGQDYYSRLQAGAKALQETRGALQIAIERRDELRRQLGGEEPVFGMVTAPVLKQNSELDALIQKHQNELEQLKLQFTDQHPDVVALSEIISQIKARRQKSIETQSFGGAVQDAAPSLVFQATTIALSQAEIEVSTLGSKAAQLEAIVDDLKKSVDTIPEVEAQLASLNRDYDVTSAQYEALAKRLESARLSQEAEQSNEDVKFQIIEPPVAPPTPISANRPLFLTAVLGAGLLVGSGFAFVLHRLSPVFIDSRTLSEVIGFPTLGIVSLQRDFRASLRHRDELSSLVGVIVLLVCAYGGAIALQENGAPALQRLISELKVQA